MIVGILKEIKSAENRVSMTPAGVETLVQNSHAVLVEKDAGKGTGFTDNDYVKVGGEIVASPGEIYKRADMVMHVKEPLPSEYDLIRKDQIIFTFLHLAANEKLTRALIKSRSVCIAYETIQKPDGSLPLLTPMSEIAGRLAVQQGAGFLEMTHGGRGVLLGGVPGVNPGTVVVIGGGTAGINAAKMACGLGAKVYLLEINLARLRYLSDVMPKNCFLIMSGPAAIRKFVKKADLVVGAVLSPGAKSPLLVTRPMLKTMKKGSVIVDIAIDQGGCFETSKPTTHIDPVYTINGVLHYCVANIPGAVPITSTIALTNATLPYVVEIADKGWKRAARENPSIGSGLNVVDGKVTCRGVSDAFGLEYIYFESMIESSL
ncbi:alanine dehydrogenase [Desulfosarcina sp. BuS5]|uniref:alanine dehydrogenase n=1 Tax=Desulfosarcina sp. BuS5 TaxID=933262 RepID=UPI00047FD0CA|nr:alanine dehydrogenase [Desulfosarcina sp. BuS5]WDN90354.1 alanine dehydrogenase [Desulfosarcina sp. BuS5]